MGTSYGINPYWAATTDKGRTHIATSGIVQDGLVFNLDAGVSSSYSGTGTNFADLTGNQNLSLSGSPTYSSTDGYGAIVFNGSNWATATGLSTSSPLSVTNNFTIEQVFKPTGYQASNYYGLTNILMSKGTASTYNYETQLTNATTFSFIKRTSPENLQYHNFTVPSMTHQFNIVALVIENGINTSIDTVKCYVNGNYIGVANIAGSAIAAVANDPIYLGSLGGTANTGFIGSYYACRVYNIALTEAQVKRNYNAMKGRYGL